MCLSLRSVLDYMYVTGGAGIFHFFFKTVWCLRVSRGSPRPACLSFCRGLEKSSFMPGSALSRRRRRFRELLRALAVVARLAFQAAGGRLALRSPGSRSRAVDGGRALSLPWQPELLHSSGSLGTLRRRAGEGNHLRLFN